MARQAHPIQQADIRLLRVLQTIVLSGGIALTEEGVSVFESANRLLASVDTFAAEVNEVNDRLDL